MKFKFDDAIELILEKEGGVLFDKKNELFYGVDKVGGVICEQIKLGVDFEQIIDALEEKYDVERFRGAHDAELFIKSMQDRGIVSESND